MTMLAIRILILLVTATLAIRSQSFDVVSVKPNNSGSGRSTENTNPGRVIAENISARSLITQAFGVRQLQILGGPGWVTTDNFDISATTGTTKDLNDRELRPYFESLLTQRFGFKYHRETKDAPIYSLVAGKGGARLTPHEGEVNTSVNISSGSGKVSVNACCISMADFANLLSGRSDRIVVDNTGISGSYDVKLEWAPDPAPESTIPSLFAALQEELGLRLEPARGPVEMIVIDSIEKPTEN
jgi:uncharacterized protein (TIGR03435 family)